MDNHTHPLVGTWSLRSYVVEGSDGSVRHPLGEHPVGTGIYTAGGHVAAQLMRPGDRRDDRRDYIAYAGRWTVDGATVSHEVELALHDDWIGTTMARTFHLDGTTLVLEPPSTTRDGVEFHSALTWSRAGSR